MTESFKDNLETLVYRINDDGIAATVEQYPHLFERISDQLGFLAWTIAADMAVLRERLAEIAAENNLEVMS